MEKHSQQNIPYKRIVIKLGTSLLTRGTQNLDHTRMGEIVSQIDWLAEKGAEIALVSSGAIAAGREKLGNFRKVKGIPYKQVLAAVGQNRLMTTYEKLFNRHEIVIAQALLSKADLKSRQGYLNARNTLLTLFEMGVICIINENDVVAVDELDDAKFGDNDNLSAMVANMIDADLLLILTDIDGLYTADPSKDKSATLIDVVEKIDGKIEKLVSGSRSGLGTGGMITKIEAAKLATSSGVDVIIADGRDPAIIEKIFSGKNTGTKFLSASCKLGSRDRWLLSGLKTKGTIIVDPGANNALKEYNRSLLSAGIADIEGNFKRGDIVDICTTEGERIGCGITNYSAKDIISIKGIRSEQINQILGYDFGPEIIHRNNLVIIL